MLGFWKHNLTGIPRVFRFGQKDAGSPGDENLANIIHQEFEKFKLDKVWDDEHYVRLQTPGYVLLQFFISELLWSVSNIRADSI